MKHIKLFENELSSDTIDFTIWCLSQKKYAYNKQTNKWLDLKSYEYITWEDVYVEYTANKYNL